LDRLKEIIGPAPSEQTKEELMSFLRKEHTRVSEGLATAMAYNAKKSAAKRKSPTKARMKQVDKAMKFEAYCRSINKTPEEVMRQLEKGEFNE